jgi:hypothetical protein
VEHYLSRLETNPELHDKIEFDIVLTCLTFDYDAQIQPLLNDGFTTEELEPLREGLRAITQESYDRIEPDPQRIERPDDRYDRIIESELPPRQLFPSCTLGVEHSQLRAASAPALSGPAERERRAVVLRAGVRPAGRLGGVHQRWLTRPFVPFPEELEPGEKDYYRPYLFQARSERHAENLIDCQAMRPYEGWAARTLMAFVFERAESNLEQATRLAERLSAALDGDPASEYDDLRVRLETALCVLRNGRNAINYQAIRDHVRDRGVEPDDTPVLGAQSGWERDFMLDTARSEIDNTLTLIDLLEAADGTLLHCADSEEETDIRLLEPEPVLIEHLERKVEIMNEQWTEYRRLFTQPNP